MFLTRNRLLLSVLYLLWRYLSSLRLDVRGRLKSVSISSSLPFSLSFSFGFSFISLCEWGPFIDNSGGLIFLEMWRLLWWTFDLEAMRGSDCLFLFGGVADYIESINEFINKNQEWTSWINELRVIVCTRICSHFVKLIKCELSLLLFLFVLVLLFLFDKLLSEHVLLPFLSLLLFLFDALKFQL